MSNPSEAAQQANRTGLDPLRLVVIFFLVATIVLALFLSHVLSLVWGAFGWPNQVLISGPDWDVPTVLGVLVAVALGVFCYFNKSIRSRPLESATELMKVTWPSWGETKTSTFAVIIASMVAAIILFGIDTLSYQIMVRWLPAMWEKL